MKTNMIVAALCLALAAPAHAETLSNASVVAMLKAGLGDEVVIAKVKQSPGRYDLSTEQMIALKQQGVSSAVLAAMIGASSATPVSAAAAMSADSPDPLVPHPAGMYLLNGKGDAAKMLRIDPTTANQSKTGGILGYALTGGIASLSMKSVIPGASARVDADERQPTFYFFFEQTGGLSSGAQSAVWMSGSAAMVTSPNEFSLVRFAEKKDRREARVGSFNIAGAKTGVMDKDRIAFRYDQVAPGVFKVTPEAPLAPGEYGFLYSIAAGGGPGMFGAGMTARVFDFTVK